MNSELSRRVARVMIAPAIADLSGKDRARFRTSLQEADRFADLSSDVQGIIKDAEEWTDDFFGGGLPKVSASPLKALPPFFKQDWLKLTAEQAARLARNEAIRLGQTTHQVQQVGNVVFEYVHVHTTNRGAIYQRELLRYLNAGKTEEEARRLADLAARGIKDLSYLSQTRGGALVPPAKQRSRLGSKVVKKPKLKSIFSYLRKGEGEPCEQGETAAQSGCIPSSGEEKPAKESSEETPKLEIDPRHVDVSHKRDYIGETEGQTVFLEKGDYFTDPNNFQSELIDVHRWVIVDDISGRERHGQWTADIDEARSEADHIIAERKEREREAAEEEERIAANPYSNPNDKLPDSARPSLTKDEIRVLKSYTSDLFEEMNATLRAGERPEGEAAQVYRIFNSIFSRLDRFDKPVTVYRGLEWSVTKDDQKQKTEFLDLLRKASKTGNALSMAGFLSTTTNKKIADSFSGSSVLLEIEALEGLDVRSISSVPEEDELIMPQNSTFKVIGFSDKGEGGIHVRLRQVFAGEE